MAVVHPMKRNSNFHVYFFYLGLYFLFFLYCGFKSQAKKEKAPPTHPLAFFYSKLLKRARNLSFLPYQPPPKLPYDLGQLSYDQWFGISFRDPRGIFSTGSRFIIKPFPLGYLFSQPLTIHLITSKGEEKNYPFDPSLFDYKDLDSRNWPKDLGFAGFRVFFDEAEKKSWAEVLSVIGASYFRSLGLGETWGLSARALTVNTTGSSREEFPFYREFWIEEPKKEDSSLSFYALLDGESLTAALQFLFTPGLESKIEIENFIFLRKTVESLGIAPLTSMFLQGENSTTFYNLLHPEEHDSDGLLMQMDTGEWIWRPLQNPPYFSSFRFPVKGKLLGFGLLQRDRSFDHYKSLLLRYESRPSAWIKPLEGWEGGHLELVELPTTTEIKDNIVAYWVAEAPALSQKQFHYSYTIFWGRDPQPRSELGFIVSTRCARIDKTISLYVIDFSIPGYSEDLLPQPMIYVGEGGRLVESGVERNPFVSGLRLSFKIERQGLSLIPLRAYLQTKDVPLTETWDYVDFP
uniref:Glucans biosynthesis protein n=1 Tax=Candidatus Methylacidiphilum infernorum TaxID=511746 RepID=A0A1W5LCZ1_9BACT|nr:glucans biosynthesis protein [Candidatus Methylacidiphilum infernorum]